MPLLISSVFIIFQAVAVVSVQRGGERRGGGQLPAQEHPDRGVYETVSHSTAVLAYYLYWYRKENLHKNYFIAVYDGLTTFSWFIKCIFSTPLIKTFLI